MWNQRWESFIKHMKVVKYLCFRCLWEECLTLTYITGGPWLLLLIVTPHSHMPWGHWCKKTLSQRSELGSLLPKCLQYLFLKSLQHEKLTHRFIWNLHGATFLIDFMAKDVLRVKSKATRTYENFGRGSEDTVLSLCTSFFSFCFPTHMTKSIQWGEIQTRNGIEERGCLCCKKYIFWKKIQKTNWKMDKLAHYWPYV